MAKKKQLIVPIFIPFGGCRERCVFCDQKGIAGVRAMPSVEEVTQQVRRYLGTWKGSGRREVAFYGGSFTGLGGKQQEAYLACVQPFIASGSMDGIRVSTRPDYISEDGLRLLKRYGVETVELGVQSMDDEVLRLSGRGHTAADTVRAVGLLKKGGFRVGVQVMPGLPGDTADTVLRTAEALVGLEPGFARIYPTLVLQETELYRMWREGRYTPWGLEEMTRVVAGVYDLFTSSGVPVIRVGLQPTRELEENLAAGPYHRSMRQLLERR